MAILTTNIDSKRKVITYDSLSGLENYSKNNLPKELRNEKIIFETNASYSISVFVNKIRIELHIFYKQI